MIARARGSTQYSTCYSVRPNPMVEALCVPRCSQWTITPNKTLPIPSRSLLFECTMTFGEGLKRVLRGGERHLTWSSFPCLRFEPSGCGCESSRASGCTTHSRWTDDWAYDVTLSEAYAIFFSFLFLRC